MRQDDSGCTVYAPISSLVQGSTLARPSRSMMSFTAASVMSHALRVVGCGSYFSVPRPNICCETRHELPVVGGAPNTPSLSSSIMVKMVSQFCHCLTSSFFAAPNQLGFSAPGTCTRIVPRPGGKYNCSNEYRSYSGRLPSRLSQVATHGPLPIWFAW